LRIGLLSTARINALGIILPAKKRQDVQVTAVASRFGKTVQAYAKKYNILQIFDNYNDLIICDQIDAVYISLPNILHFPYAKKCLENKKHVLCEKPATLRVSELEELETIANKNNCFFLDAMHYYLYPTLQTVVKDLQKYKNKIQYIEAFLGFPRPPDDDIRLNATLGGGAHNHLLCYVTHFMTWLFPDKKWSFKIFDKKIYHGVDVYKTIRFASIEETPLIFDAAVSLDHTKIESWISIKWEKYFMKIDHAFTPTTFFDRTMPYKNIMQIYTNHYMLSKKDYSFEGMKTSYDYQLDYFIKYTTGFVKQGVFKEAYRLFEQSR
jgi:predicted dehydrogenase